MQASKINKDAGFTLIEVILSLIMLGFIAVVAGMGIVSFTKGVFFAKENTHKAQKVQLAMARLNRELMELTNIAAKDDTPPNPFVIYDNITGRHAIAKDGSDLKMFNLPSGTVTLPPTGDNKLMDNVDSFTLTYYKDYEAIQNWVFGMDDMSLLTAIEVDLKLIGVGGTFSTLVFPRNK